MEKDRFDIELDKIMEGVCPACGNPLLEEETNPAMSEWTITCTGCPYLMVFGGV
jgi:hypothetical protein